MYMHINIDKLHIFAVEIYTWKYLRHVYCNALYTYTLFLNLVYIVTNYSSTTCFCLYYLNICSNSRCDHAVCV